MTNGSFDLDSLVAFWREEAEEALRAAEHLIEKTDYSYALFFGHLAVEKALKAAYVARRKEHAPLTHNLVRLARGAGLDIDAGRVDALTTITAFHLEARYPDVKRTFRQRCTPEYTQQQMAVIKEVFAWLTSLLA